MNNGDKNSGDDASLRKTSQSETTIISDLSDATMVKMSSLILEALNVFDASTLQVRHSSLNAKIDGNIAKINDVNVNISALSDRLSEVEKENTRLKQELANKDAKVDKIRADFKSHTDVSARHRNNYQHIHDLTLFQLSQREQRERNRTIKVINFQHSSPVNDVLIYETLIRPTLQAALDQGNLRFLPDEMDSVIEYCHPLKERSDGLIQTWHFVFFSRSVLDIYMSHKWPVLDKLNEENKLPAQASYADTTKHIPNRTIKVSRDMSLLNRQTMTALYRSPLVKACKLRNVKVCFQLVDGSKRWFPVENPFSDDIIGMMRPIPTISKIYRDERYPNPLIYEDGDDEVPDDDPSVVIPAATHTVASPVVPVDASLTNAPAVVSAVAPPVAPVIPAAAGVHSTASAAPTDLDPEISAQASALAKSLLAAQANSPKPPGKRPAAFSPIDKPGAKKVQPPLSPMERRSMRAQHKNKKHR